MTRFKRFLAILASAILCLGVCVFASCNKDDTNNAPATAYTLIVQYEDKTPVVGISMKLCKVDANGNELLCYDMPATDANGKTVSTNVSEPAVLHVGIISGCPAGYTIADDIYTKAQFETITITLIQE
ncbi:MAG: hypothetical protein IJX88_04840 [Clostridia bacterium]|nr:hypothetical protein [Clostridia bacterium]